MPTTGEKRKAILYRYNRTEKRKAAAKRYKEKNRAYYAAKQRERYAKDKEYLSIKAFCKHYGTEPEILKIVRERDKVCQLCGTSESLQFDHIFPVKLGGKGTIENLQLLCGSCNRFKHCNLFLPDGGMMIVNHRA